MVSLWATFILIRDPVLFHLQWVHMKTNQVYKDHQYCKLYTLLFAHTLLTSSLKLCLQEKVKNCSNHFILQIDNVNQLKAYLFFLWDQFQ